MVCATSLYHLCTCKLEFYDFFSLETTSASTVFENSIRQIFLSHRDGLALFTTIPLCQTLLVLQLQTTFVFINGLYFIKSRMNCLICFVCLIMQL